jgi:hypothetical protein
VYRGLLITASTNRIINHITLIVMFYFSGSDGLLTLLAIREFDGTKFVEEVNEV